jgi:hypothetical protein
MPDNFYYCYYCYYCYYYYYYYECYLTIILITNATTTTTTQFVFMNSSQTFVLTLSLQVPPEQLGTTSGTILLFDQLLSILLLGAWGGLSDTALITPTYPTDLNLRWSSGVGMGQRKPGGGHHWSRSCALRPMGARGIHPLRSAGLAHGSLTGARPRAPLRPPARGLPAQPS